MKSVLLIAVGLAVISHVASSLEQDMVDGIRTQIRAMIDSEPLENNREQRDRIMLGGLVRLAFHDCVGNRCDGCINHDHADNAGLSVYTTRADQLYTTLQVNGADVDISRADFWALAGIEAAYYASELATSSHSPNITFRSGREDCPTSPTTEESHDFPSALGDTDHVLEFFNREFGFDAKESAAILGGHTLGSAHSEASGFVHPWVSRKDRLDNQFYTDLNNASKGWTQRFIGPSASRQYFWESAGDQPKLMLNADMALIRNMSGATSTGQVSCTYSTCPVITSTGTWVTAFAANNTLWLDEFSKAFEKMIEKGWTGNLLEIETDTFSTTESSASGIPLVTFCTLMLVTVVQFIFK